ncbi:MAG: hypothetical protein EZS28_037650 [Streblomastix strix]|uniref:Uncharacterized protein n=1 Tax=Streblomastix strix TaxID=222440 RepID=A0A5J4U9C8_9EUKA|nr:MAG: hypothetical protein EZS28_037650 [Streblomastix strix]
MSFVRASISASFSNFDPSMLIIVSSRVGIHLFGGPEMRQGDVEIIKHYPISPGDEDNYWLPSSLLISPLY